VERRVGAERGEVGKVRAQRVVHGDRAVGAADGDVDVEAEDELAARDARELGGERLVARTLVQLAERARERMRARAGDERPAVERGGEVAARVAQPRRRPADGRHRRADALQLGGGQLELEALVAAELRQRVARAGLEVERPRVQEHELLLDTDRARPRRLERGPGSDGGRLRRRRIGGRLANGHF
jgi:hypothetical protein